MSAITSPEGHGLGFTTWCLAVGNGASPQIFTPIANLTDWSMPTSTVMVDNTNSSDSWVSRQPVIQDMGKITFKVEYQPQDPSMYNGANGGSVAPGLRYLQINKTLTNFQSQYPGYNPATPGVLVDEFPGYITDTTITSKVKDIFHMSGEITNSGAPVLC